MQNSGSSWTLNKPQERFFLHTGLTVQCQLISCAGGVFHIHAMSIPAALGCTPAGCFGSITPSDIDNSVWKTELHCKHTPHVRENLSGFLKTKKTNPTKKPKQNPHFICFLSSGTFLFFQLWIARQHSGNRLNCTRKPQSAKKVFYLTVRNQGADSSFFIPPQNSLSLLILGDWTSSLS